MGPARRRNVFAFNKEKSANPDFQGSFHLRSSDKPRLKQLLPKEKPARIKQERFLLKKERPLLKREEPLLKKERLLLIYKRRSL
jgi:hypothetical protein